MKVLGEMHSQKWHYKIYLDRSVVSSLGGYRFERELATRESSEHMGVPALFSRRQILTSS